MNGNSCIRLLVVIVERGKGDGIIEFLRDQNILFNVVLLGHGTASKQWQNVLGIGDSKKDIVLSVLAKDRVEDAFNILKEEFNLKEPGHGIAFTVNINSISSKRVLNFCLGKVEEQ